MFKIINFLLLQKLARVHLKNHYPWLSLVNLGYPWLSLSSTTLLKISTQEIVLKDFNIFKLCVDLNKAIFPLISWQRIEYFFIYMKAMQRFVASEIIRNNFKSFNIFL